MLSSGFRSIHSGKLSPHYSASLGCMSALQTSLQGDSVAYCSLTHNGLLTWLYFSHSICTCSGSDVCVCIQALPHTQKKSHCSHKSLGTIRWSLRRRLNQSLAEKLKTVCGCQLSHPQKWYAGAESGDRSSQITQTQQMQNVI